MPARGHTDLTDPNEGAAALMLGMKFCFEFDFVNCEQAVLVLLHSPRQGSSRVQAEAAKPVHNNKKVTTKGFTRCSHFVLSTGWELLEIRGNFRWPHSVMAPITVRRFYGVCDVCVLL